jgi:hypothetical protein
VTSTWQVTERASNIALVSVIVLDKKAMNSLSIIESEHPDFYFSVLYSISPTIHGKQFAPSFSGFELVCFIVPTSIPKQGVMLLTLSFCSLAVSTCHAITNDSTS